MSALPKDNLPAKGRNISPAPILQTPEERGGFAPSHEKIPSSPRPQPLPLKLVQESAAKDDIDIASPSSLKRASVFSQKPPSQEAQKNAEAEDKPSPLKTNDKLLPLKRAQDSAAKDEPPSQKAQKSPKTEDEPSLLKTNDKLLPLKRAQSGAGSEDAPLSFQKAQASMAEDGPSSLKIPSLELESKKTLSPSFIRFCEGLGAAYKIQDLLPALKSRLPKKFKTGEWVLFYSSPTGLKRAYIRNKQFYEQEASQAWPSFKGIQFADRKTQLYIAGEMGRPFAGGLAVPLFYGQLKGDLQAFLFVECHIEGKLAHSLLDFFKQALVVLRLAFKKAFIDRDTGQEAYLWSGLFHHWTEPLAVLKDFSPAHINRAFQKWFSLSPHFLREKKLSSFDDRPVAENGRLWRVYYYPITQLKGEAGILYCQDVTKKAQLKEQIQQSGKMTALALLGESAGRQLNRPLADLQNKAQALARAPFLMKFQAEFKELERASSRSQKTLQNLLFFSQEGVSAAACNLNEAVEGALALLKRACKGIALDVRLPQAPLQVRGDGSLLQHVVYNLILNACQALNSAGLKSPHIMVSAGRANQNQAVLKVKDNGPGIAPENLKKIFQPLWTGKKAYGGTGLGLSLARQFIRQMGGDVFVSSRQNEWTCFSALLPCLKN